MLDDHNRESESEAVVWTLGGESENMRVPEEDMELVTVASCHCNFCNGAGDHPECPGSRVRDRRRRGSTD